MHHRNVWLWTLVLSIIWGYAQAASAEDVSLVDVLRAKGVLSASEAESITQSAKNKENMFVLGGRMQVDFATYKNPPGINLADGAEVRRARLFAKGHVGAFYYKAQYDFAGNAVSMKDMYLEYRGLPLTIRLGNATEPFTMEDNTSSKYLTFMERAMNNAFAPGRKLGLSLIASGESWGAVGGLYTNGAGGASTGIDSRFDASARFSMAPFHERTSILHLGASVNYQLPDSTRQIRMRARPESHITGVRFVDTGTLGNVDHLLQYGLEFAGVMGRFSLQSEYTHSLVKYRSAATPASNFSGYYATVSCFLTGESRSYDVAEGTFGRIHPLHPFQPKGDGWGAWEIASRLSQIDLEDTGVAGGKARNIALALNWYPHSHLRWMLNWIHASVDRSPLAPLQTGFGPDVFQMRVQVDF